MSEVKYYISDLETGEPIEVSKAVWEIYTKIMDEVKKHDENGKQV